MQQEEMLQDCWFPEQAAKDSFLIQNLLLVIPYDSKSLDKLPEAIAEL